MDRNLLYTIENSFRDLWSDVILFLPELVIAIVVVVIGWMLGGILKGIVERVVRTFKLDKALDAAGVDTLSQKAGYDFKPAEFIGSLIKWFVIIVFFVAALEILNLGEVTIFFRDVVLGYLPRVIVAVLVLFGALIVANLVSASVEAAARAANFGSAGMLGSVARYAIIVFAVLAALSQLQIAPALVQMLFAGFVFGASLAFGLAFGLGGREMATKYLAKVEREVSSGDHHPHN